MNHIKRAAREKIITPGMEHTQFVTALNDTAHIQSRELIFWSKDDDSRFREWFAELKDSGIIESGQFSDNLWKCQRDNGHITRVEFGLELYGEIQNALKCYAVSKLMEKRGPQTVRNNTIQIAKIAILTQGFALDKKDEMSGYSSQYIQQYQTDIAKVTAEFLAFYDYTKHFDYILALGQYKGSHGKPRELPPYQSILLFNGILLDYFENEELADRVRFFPVYLWWRITKIIPMRPSEFLGTKKDCTSKDDNNKYWITIGRRKQPAEGGRLEVTDTLQITKEIYNLVEEYKALTEPIEPEREFLISYEAWVQTRKHNRPVRKPVFVFEVDQLQTSINNFYDEVVEKQYNTEITGRVSPGDTRHFAFCNMKLQGFNMLTIARIGGHNQINTQLHYHSHLDFYAESYVDALKKQYLFKKMDDFSQRADYTIRKMLVKSKLSEAFSDSKKHRVDYGYCSDKPWECKIGDCRVCIDHFWPDNTPEARNWLKDWSDTLGQRIKEQIDLMNRITTTMIYDTKSLSYQPAGQEHLSNRARELFRLMEQKASVDSHLGGVDHEQN